MNKSSRKSTPNIYLKEDPKLLTQKYSPSYRKQQYHAFRNSLQSKSSNRVNKIAHTQDHPYLHSHKSPKTPRIANPERRSQSKTSSMKEFQLSLSRKLQMQKAKLQSLQTKSRLRQEEMKRAQSLKKRLDTQESQRSIKQIQFKYQQAKREQDFKLKREKSERSFIFETHKESIDMLKKSRHIRSRSQMKLNKAKYYETEKNHQFLTTKKKVNQIQQKYEIKYHKAFLKNEPFKANKYPNLAATLAISSKMIGSSESKAKILPKIQIRSTQQSNEAKEITQSNRKVHSNIGVRSQTNQVKNSQAIDIKIQKEAAKHQNKQQILQIKPTQNPEKLQLTKTVDSKEPITIQAPVDPKKQDIDIKNS